MNQPFLLSPTSLVTFLTLDDLKEGEEFFGHLLGLPLLYDPGWAKIWQVAGGGMIGAVSRGRDTIRAQRPDGALLSITLPALEGIHRRITSDGRWQPGPIREVPGIPLRSFFLTGPGGYSFEFQQFTDPVIAVLFAPGDAKPDPVPVLETPRLLLRPLTAADVEPLLPILGDAQVMAAWEHSFSREQVEDWVRRNQARRLTDGYGYYTAIEKATGRLVGQIGLLREEVRGESRLGIGYLLGRDSWGKGYATEGATACVHYAFTTMEAPEILCEVRPENTASAAVARRLGMTLTDSFVKIYRGKEMPHHIYTLTRQDWLGAKEETGQFLPVL